MKKFLVSIALLVIICSVVYAGDNQSAKYVRLLSRNAAIDSIDIVYFNPAGTAFLQEGFHIQLNGQAVWLNYSHELSPKTYTMKNLVPFIPSAYMGYKGGNWALFAGYSIPYGGGSLKWDSVKIFTSASSSSDVEFEGESATHMLSLGGSYAFSQIAALGARFDVSFTSEEYKVSTSGVKAELTKSGTGFGGTLGIHLHPNEAINASLTVSSNQEIELEEKSSSGAAQTLGLTKKLAPTEADTPWVFRAGFSYTFPFGLEIPVSAKYSLWKEIDAENENTITAALGLRYWLTEKLEISLGTSYQNANKKKDKLDGTFLDPELSSLTIGGGIGWEIFDDFNLDLGLLYPMYYEADGKMYKKLNKQVIDINLGIGYVF